ncbi:MAG: hypothetical protein QOC59_822 [Microbacteriaceae bacterium]|nr:hypothetical protein [Microbacteriaceae bacterium]
MLSAFAMVACAGIAFVTVTDPYAGATAAPYYLAPVTVTGDHLQRFPIKGGYVLVDVKRDKFQAIKPLAAHKAAASGGSAGSSGGGGGGGGYTTPVGTAQTFAAQLVAGQGWGASEFTCLVNLWNRESGWNTHAYNPSGAYGIPQALPGSKMASFGGDWQNDYRVQIRWGLSYIKGSYGSPCGAWGHSNSYNWY